MSYLLYSSVFYIFGLLLSKNNIFITPIYFITSIVLVVVLNISIYYIKRINIVTISIICILSCYLGTFLYNNSLYEPQKDDLYSYTSNIDFNNISVDGLVGNEPKVSLDKISFEFLPQTIIYPKNTQISGKVQVFIYTDKLRLNYGDKIQIKGKLSIPSKSANPDEFDYANYLKKENIFTVITANSDQDIKVIEAKTIHDFNNFILNTKSMLLDIFYKNMPKDSASLVSSLIFGSKASPVPKEVQDEFINLGLAHVLAASGMQVSLIMGLGLLLTKKSKINSIIGNIITAITIIFYMFLTGFPASILRAGFVSLIILAFAHKNQKLDSFKVLFIVSFGLIIWNPQTFFDIGFQFSVLATFGLLYISPLLVNKMDFLPDFTTQIISIILSAQLIVMPLQLFYFGQFSYLFLPANIIATLFVDLLTYLAILTLTLGLIIPFISVFLGKILFYLLSIFLYSLGLLNDLPFAVSYIARPDISMVILLYCLVFLFVELIKMDEIKISEFKKPKYISLLALCIINFGYKFYNYIAHLNDLSIVYINVGQGDSSFIQTPSGKTILIDCGQSFEMKKFGKTISLDAAKKYIIPYFQHNGIKHLDYLILTHPDSDHIGGCQAILEKIKVDKVIDSGQFDESKPYTNLFIDILKRDIPIQIAQKGELYNEKNLSIKVVDDINVDETDEHSYNNNNGIALKMIYGKNSFLFMADLEKEAEEKLIDSKQELNVDVLKVGHHGSKTSSTQEFIDIVKPKYSVVSVGKNHYGHPSKDVVKRLEDSGSKVYRTDKSGGIVIKSDGNNVNISTSY